MHQNPLTLKIDSTTDALSARLDEASAHQATRDRPRDPYTAIDTFLASCSQHVAGVTEVLLPEVRRHLREGTVRAYEFTRHARQLEMALNRAKARLYGGAYVANQSWPVIWQEVREEFDQTMDAERDLGHELARLLDRQHSDDLTERLYRSEQHGPTRPHPFVPHRGVPGRLARRVARRIDRFWDAAEGRMIPEPVRHHDRGHDGPLTQYLLSDPHLDPEERS